MRVQKEGSSEKFVGERGARSAVRQRSERDSAHGAKIHRDPESIADLFQVHHESLPLGGVTVDPEEDREDEGKGDDFCETCGRTEREISYTTTAGKTVCVTCDKGEVISEDRYLKSWIGTEKEKD